MNAEIFAALAQLEKERGIPQDYMLEKITQALIAAYKKDKEGYTDNVFVEIKDNDMHMYVQKEVVDDVLTPATEISLDEARKINKHADLGDLVNVDVKTQAFGRIAAQTARSMRSSAARCSVPIPPRATSSSASPAAATRPPRSSHGRSRFLPSIIPRAI